MTSNVLSITYKFNEVQCGNGQSSSKTGTKTGTSEKSTVILTDQKIKALGKTAVAEGRDIKAKDVTTKGLLLFSRSNGTQSWLFRFAIDGHDKSVTLGQYPKMTLAQARIDAETARSSVKVHGDVNGQKTIDQPFSAFVEQWYNKWNKSKRQHTIDLHSPIVKKINSKLGLMKPAQITTGKIMQELEGLHATTAERALLIVRGSLRQAVLKGAVETNVAREIQTGDLDHKEKKSIPRTALKLADVPTVINKVAKRSQAAADVLWIVALCATRAEETVLMEWNQVNWEQKLWNIPAENRKGKLEKRHPLAVPLSDAAIAKLRESASRATSARWVFEGNLDHHIDRRTVLANLKLQAKATVHGFRSLFKTEAAEAGYPAHLTEAALGHSIRGLEGVYNKATYLEMRRELMQWWAGKLLPKPNV